MRNGTESNLTCDAEEQNIYILSKKCLENKYLFYSLNCRNIGQAKWEEAACLVWISFSLALGILGNTVTLIAIPYAKKQNRWIFILQLCYFKRMQTQSSLPLVGIKVWILSKSSRHNISGLSFKKIGTPALYLSWIWLLLSWCFACFVCQVSFTFTQTTSGHSESASASL